MLKFIYRVLTHTGLWKLIPDRMALKILFRVRMHKKLNLRNPSTFNEQLQWLKLYDRKPIYSKMVDKYEAKEYVAKRIGEKYIIPTFGIWDKFEDIDFNSLPDQFVLKCTHDSGGLVICRDKSEFDRDAAKMKISRSLHRNYFWTNREWPCKNVKPRIIAEQYMVDSVTAELRDYKFFCFNGICRCFKVDFDRFIDHHANYYNCKGELLSLGERVCTPVPQKNIQLPAELNAMIDLAEKLCENIPFLRVDFYNMNGRIFFGELTFYPASGLGAFTDDKWDLKLGDYIELPQKEKHTNIR